MGNSVKPIRLLPTKCFKYGLNPFKQTAMVNSTALTKSLPQTTARIYKNVIYITISLCANLYGSLHCQFRGTLTSLSTFGLVTVGNLHFWAVALQLAVLQWSRYTASVMCYEFHFTDGQPSVHDLLCSILYTRPAWNNASYSMLAIIILLRFGVFCIVWTVCPLTIAPFTWFSVSR